VHSLSHRLLPPPIGTAGQCEATEAEGGKLIEVSYKRLFVLIHTQSTSACTQGPAAQITVVGSGQSYVE